MLLLVRILNAIHHIIVFLAVFVSIAGCQSQHHEQEQALSSSSLPISYYYWKTNIDIPADWIQEYAPQKMYVKALDIAYRNKVELVVSNLKHLDSVSFVPVVFIEYKLFSHKTAEQVSDLIMRQLPPEKYPAIQMDCDWTLQSKESYFQFLSILKQNYQDLSVTIRLHQVKYFQKTGVPPAHRGVLMYYNMSDVRDPSTENYILDLDIAKKYHYNFDSYPLQLDLALPIYKHGRVFRRDKLAMLLNVNRLNTDSLAAIGDGNNRVFKVLKGHYSGGKYLYQDDIIKIDEVSFAQLSLAVEGLQDIMNPKEIIFYEQAYAKDFGAEKLSILAKGWENTE